MSLLPFARRAAMCVCWGLFLVAPAVALAQTNYYRTNGVEYAVVGQLPGDQILPDAAVATNGGYVVWQDNATDGSGWGVSARRLDGTLSGTLSAFRVNVTGTNDQENARVALLKNGGAVFVWQGGVEGINQHVYARFMNSSGVFLTTTDVLVNTFVKNYQVNPAVAVLNNSNVVVVWDSYNQAGSNSMKDVYGQIFSQTGLKIGGEFLINQFTTYNQRNPTIAALKNGGFVVAWVSEQQRVVGVPNPPSVQVQPGQESYPSVDVYARLYKSNGVAAVNGAGTTNEFLVNTDSNPCANPAVAAGSDGGFMAAWSALNLANPANGWDIHARAFSSAFVGGSVLGVNSYLYGNQYAPRVSSIGVDYLVTWISSAQDGSREGVFAQFLNGNGTYVGGEFRVNTTTVNSQMQPVVASDGMNQFLVVWTSFTGLQYGFDLYAQRYLNVASLLPPMAAPFVWAPFRSSNGVYQPQLQVSWTGLPGISISNYGVYVDGGGAPTVVTTSNVWTMTAANGLTPSSKHWFQVAYQTAAGKQSPLSPATTNSTWSGNSWSGVPDEWMTNYYGSNMGTWPSAGAPVVAGGPSLYQIFLSGGDPKNPSTWLRQQLVNTGQGWFLIWNTQPGLTYQVQVKTNLSSTTWSNLGAPRFATGTSDSILVGSGPAGYYQILLQR